MEKGASILILYSIPRSIFLFPYRSFRQSPFSPYDM